MKSLIIHEAAEAVAYANDLDVLEIHREDLLADWELAVNGKNPFPIKGLDQ